MPTVELPHARSVFGIAGMPFGSSSILIKLSWRYRTGSLKHWGRSRQSSET